MASFQWVDEPNLFSIAYTELMRIATERLDKGRPCNVASGGKNSEIPLKELLAGLNAHVRFRALSSDTNHVLFRVGLERSADEVLGAILHEGSSSSYHVYALADTEEQALQTRDQILKALPPIAIQDDQVLINFWSMTASGPTSRTRRVESNVWSEISSNYADSTKAAVSHLLSWKTSPSGGRLLVFHGPPGTGKTHAIRALAHEWRSWCDLHYVVDSEEFFGRANYMLSVLLQGGLIEDESFHPSMRGPDRWRLIIVEDADELLRHDAMSASKQNLSRLLNLCDGLIGQGLRVLVLLTTNEKLNQLHPAIMRPGRCVAEIEFSKLGPNEASAWLGRRVPQAATIAELYEMNRNEKISPAERPETKVGAYL